MSANKLRFFSFFALLCLSLVSFSQKTKGQLEKEKKENLRKIAEAERILTETANQKKVSLGQLQALNQQINARESLIRSISSQIKLLDDEISDLTIVVTSLQSDLTALKDEYAAQIYSTYKANRGYSKLMFLFSSKSFNQLFQRLKYLEQYSEARRLQVEQIEVVTKELNDQKSKVQAKRAQQQVLLNQQIRESKKLERSKKKQSELVAQLTKKEKDLKKEVNNRKKANKRLNTLIANIAESEVDRSKTISVAEAASEAELTRLFETNKNKLQWPVNSGFITSKFGRQRHPVLKQIIVVNDGVGIQTEKNSSVQAVFDGEVTLVGSLPGMHNLVIIRHGAYKTVYARLKTINVKKGQKVRKGDVIGEIYTNKDGISELEFQVYKGISKLNPENWLALK